MNGQKLLAQGNTLGIDNIEMVITPCKGKSFHTAAIFLKLLPLQGAELQQLLPRALPWARSFCPFRACRENQASTLPHQLVNVVLKHSDTAAFFIH